MCLLRGTGWVFKYTATLTFNNSTFCPHSVFMCSVWIWEQTAIISLYSINWLVCITETECVYCVVRTGSLYIIQVICFVWIWEQTVIISLYNINWLVYITETECVYCAVRTDTIQVNFRHRCAEARVRSQAGPSKICCVQSGTGTGFSPVTSASPFSTIPPMLHTHLHLRAALTRTNGQSLGTFQKAKLLLE